MEYLEKEVTVGPRHILDDEVIQGEKDKMWHITTFLKRV